MSTSGRAFTDIIIPFQEFCFEIGYAMMAWQKVEDAHFALFFKMLGAPQYEIASLVYFINESFEARHRLVGLMIAYFLAGKGNKRHRSQWANETGGLQKRLKDANENRNKLAHYSNETDSSAERDPDGSIKVSMRLNRLQPSPYNVVSRALGRTPDRPQHDLGVAEIRALRASFHALATDLDKFQKQLPLPPPQQGASVLQKIGLPPRHLMKSLQSRTRPSHTDTEPSGE